VRKQSKKMSAVESMTNAVVGLIVSWLFTYFCLPLFGLEPSPMSAIGITAAYFILSFIRGYIVRRCYEALDSSRNY